MEDIAKRVQTPDPEELRDDKRVLFSACGNLLHGKRRLTQWSDTVVLATPLEKDA